MIPAGWGRPARRPPPPAPSSAPVVRTGGALLPRTPGIPGRPRAATYPSPLRKDQSTMIKFGLGLCVALSLGLLTGCSSAKNASAPASVSGQVLYNNQPLRGGSIVFHAKTGQGSYRSALDDKGTYSITDLPV